MSLKFLLRTQEGTKYQPLRILHLCYRSNLLELRKQLVHQLLKGMIQQLMQIKLIEK